MTPRRLLRVVGPGLMVMLADTEAGSIVTAAQSGARFGYRLLFLELLLVPVLYLVMELTVRLGVVTGKGHAALIWEHFGGGFAAVSVGTLVVAAVGALVTEFAGIAGVARMVGIPPAAAVLPAAAFLVWLVLAGTGGSRWSGWRSGCSSSRPPRAGSRRCSRSGRSWTKGCGRATCVPPAPTPPSAQS